MLLPNTTITKSTAAFKRLFFYGACTAISLGIDYAVSNAIIKLDADLFFANAIGWIIGATAHLLLVSAFVFGKISFSIKIIAIYVFNMLINPYLVTSLVHYGMGLFFAKATLLITMFFVNYFLLSKLLSRP